MTTKKKEEAVYKCYVELYKNSTPSADFDKLLETAPINEYDQKVIDYMAYEIDREKYDEIVERFINEYKFTKHESQLFKNSIALGCSPKFSQKK